MVLRLILLLISIFIFDVILAQSPGSSDYYSDKKMGTLLKMIDSLKSSDPKAALEENSKLLKTLRSTKDRALSMKVLLNRASIFLSLSHTDSARYVLKQIEINRYHEDISNLDILYQWNHIQGVVLQQERNLDVAIQKFIAAKEIASDLDNKNYTCKQEFNIGICYLGSANYEEAIPHFKESKTCAEDLSDILLLTRSLNTLGLSYYFLDLLNLAESSLNLCYQIALSQNLVVLQYQSMANLANVYLDRNELNLATKTMLNSIEAATKLGDDYVVAANYVNLIRVKLRQKDLASAETYLEQLEELTMDQTMPEIVVKMNHFKAIWAFLRQDFDRGYANYLEALSLHDSIQSVEVSAKIADLELEYETAKKENEIKEQQLIIARDQKRKRNLLLLVSWFAMSLIGLSILYWNNRRNYHRKQELDQLRIDELERERQISNLSSMIDGQEAERARIAKDLHDGLGVLLSTVRRQVQNVQTEVEKLTELDLVGNTENMIQKACEEVRRISHDMMPDALMHLGLKEAIIDLAEDIRSEHQLNMDVDIEDAISLSKSQSINLYRIIQEISHNMLKYARATHFSINIYQRNDELHLLTKDNGIGFNYQNNLHLGLGLGNIESRVQYLNGSLEVQSDVGTTYHIIIPVAIE